MKRFLFLGFLVVCGCGDRSVQHKGNSNLQGERTAEEIKEPILVESQMAEKEKLSRDQLIPIDKSLYPNFTQIPVKQVGLTLDEVVASLGKWDMVGDVLNGPDGNQGYPFSNRKGYDYLVCIGAENKVTSAWKRKAGL
jgi:hypothetical protein